MNEPNLIDRAITYFSPKAGAERLAARAHLAMSGAYTGARYDRRQTLSWLTSAGSADADTIPDLPALRERSRDTARNNCLGLGAINTVVLNAAGTGLSLQPTPDSTILGWEEEQKREWAQLVSHEFALWAESPNADITRTSSFYDAQSLVLRSALESGDDFTILTQKSIPGSVYSTRFQILEADRIRTPGGEGMEALVKDKDGNPQRTGNRIYGGVEQDQYGAPVAYWVLRQHPGAIAYVAGRDEYDRYLAFGAKTGRRNVLHHFDRLRPDQSRGVPYLAPVLESLKQLDRYSEAEIMAAVITAAYTMFITSDTGDQIPGDSTVATPVREGEVALGNGKIIGLLPGEKPEFPNPMRPNAGYDPFVMSVLRQIGVALQLPFEVLIKHFTSSYSAARSALLEAWKFYNNRRNFLAQSFCQPVYEAWMDEAVSTGRIQAPGYFSSPLMRRAYLSAEWVGDAPGQIDPLKEIQAADMRVQKGVSNLHIETTALTGRQWRDVHEQRKTEHAERAAAGLEPNVLNATGTEMVPDTANQDEEDGPVEPTPVPPLKDRVKQAHKGGKK